MPLVNQPAWSVWEESFQVQKADSTRPAIPSVVPMQLFLNALEMPMKSFPALTGPVVVNHAGAIERNQDLVSVGLMDLSVRDVRRVNRAHFPALAEGKVDAFPGLPSFVQNLPPPLCCARKQVKLKVLHTLFPPYSVAAFPAITEHLAVGENFVYRPESITPSLFFRLPLRFAALITAFAPFLTCHKVLFTLRIAVL